ncbi:MAG: ADP-ribosylglycohydrolase family protein [Shewanella sp.]
MEKLSARQISAAQGSLLGLACGDALGTTLEFKAKNSFKPITDMQGGGPFRLAAGQWTDDTAMMLCLADSLIEKGCHNLDDQISRYCRWHQHGENSCTGTCFDIGNTVAAALNRYRKTGEPKSGSQDPFSAGNGSLMRIAPIALFHHRHPVEIAMHAAAQSSQTTHAEQRAVEACELMTLLIHTLLNTEQPDEKNDFLIAALHNYRLLRPHCHSDIASIAKGSFINKSRDQISGSGFVIESLEAALWCFYHSDSLAQGALMAANLGDDADTTAAIFGQLAGAYYGANSIPQDWQSKLAWQQHIKNIAVLLIGRPTNKQILGFISAAEAKIAQQAKEGHDWGALASEHGLMIPQLDYDEVVNAKTWDERIDTAIGFADASVQDCILWIMALVRGDRVNSGIMQADIRSAKLTALLQRLHFLVGGNEHG